MLKLGLGTRQNVLELRDRELENRCAEMKGLVLAIVIVMVCCLRGVESPGSCHRDIGVSLLSCNDVGELESMGRLRPCPRALSLRSGRGATWGRLLAKVPCLESVSIMEDCLSAVDSVKLWCRGRLVTASATTTPSSAKTTITTDSAPMTTPLAEDTVLPPLDAGSLGHVPAVSATTAVLILVIMIGAGCLCHRRCGRRTGQRRMRDDVSAASDTV